MNSALVPVFAVGLGAVIYFLMRNASRNAAANLRRVADQLGLKLDGEPGGVFSELPRAVGTIRGRSVEVFTYATGSGRSRQQWGAITAAAPGAGGLNFEFRRQWIGTRVMEVFGAREIEFGDPEFDRAWFLQTNQPEFLRAALLPEIRGRMSASAFRDARRGQIRLQDGVVRYAEQGHLSSAALADRLILASELVCDLADVGDVFGSESGLKA